MSPLFCAPSLPILFSLSGVLWFRLQASLYVSKRQGKTEKLRCHRLFPSQEEENSSINRQSKKKHNPMVVGFFFFVEMLRCGVCFKTTCCVLSGVGRRGFVGEKKTHIFLVFEPPSPWCLVCQLSANRPTSDDANQSWSIQESQKRQGSAKSQPARYPQMSQTERTKKEEPRDGGGAASCACPFLHTPTSCIGIKPLSLRRSLYPKLVGQPREK